MHYSNFQKPYLHHQGSGRAVSILLPILAKSQRTLLGLKNNKLADNMDSAGRYLLTL
jgi:hypothetical protein